MAGWQFWIDRGGTFTDIVARAPDGALLTCKLLSENPGRYADAAVAGIREMLGLDAAAPIPPGLIDCVKMGTTVATNALLERRGAATLLVTTPGFADALRIGTQARPRLFDMCIRLPELLHRQVVEIAGRIDAAGAEIVPLDEAAARHAFAAARAAGIEAVAIVLLHAWRYPAHEQRLAALAREAGFAQVSASHAVSPMLRLVPRGDTTVADAYLSPVLRRHVSQVAAALGATRLYFMQSHGGLADAGHFNGKDAILSGPAGGIVGAARTAESAGIARIIGFDMGGTSTDVALYAGALERSFETEIAGVRLCAPMLAINTVAAGGGSILHFRDGRQMVGPDSAGAVPGPACYRRGGPLTVTDANVLLGRLQPRHFPALFGAEGAAPLDRGIVVALFDAMAARIAAETGMPAAPEAVAAGFLRIAVANMANAIKQVSIQRGHDPAGFTLNCFGGAAGQHACAVADALGMRQVFIHPLAGVLSAYGMGLADQSVLRQRSVEMPLDAAALPVLERLRAALADEARAELAAQGAAGEQAETCTVRLRLLGTDLALGVGFGSLAEMGAGFATAHLARFGFPPPARALVVDSIVVERTAPGASIGDGVLPLRAQGVPPPLDIVRLWSDGAFHDAPVHARSALPPGAGIAGPAMIIDANATTIVDCGWQAEITAREHMILRRAGMTAAQRLAAGGRADPVLLEMFGNLFMHVAEQTGIVLQNTASSVNIKERLDFSCAIFDAAGGLVANAPHIPVHLGAMGESVRCVLASRAGRLRPGDVIALNNPANGGTHLPDVTVITPVFDAAGSELRFFVGSRGHHADIGGLTPGSMPPDSRSLEQEGVVIDDFLLVDAGTFREAAFLALLRGARYPARSPEVNLADIKAQVAANAFGARALQGVIASHGWEVVAAYMRYVMENAAECVRRVIDRLGDGAFDYRMDDGSRLAVRVRVDHAARAAEIDFTGTSPQRPDNFNAPPAVTRAAVLYVFRCLVGRDIPLNEGCLTPLRIVIPPGSFLAPAPGAAVVAGNTETSMAICCALFGALGVQASSQGTMNNFLFGDATRQYYETICGGAGAGPDYAGSDSVHTHMTNTRMTDPEVLELRYPVRLEDFAIRRGSGGIGAQRGGDGVVRRLRFLAPMHAVLVASRRSVAPFGLAGGGDGAPGRQWIVRADGRRDELGGVAAAELAAGDVVVIETPGGGGYGVARGGG